MQQHHHATQKLKSRQYRWLVTGAAGFIGSNLVEELLTQGQTVVGLDNFATGYKANLEHAISDAAERAEAEVASRFSFIEGDITNQQICIHAVRDVDFVLHQAALGSVPRSIENPGATNAANVTGFLNMLVAAKDAEVKRFVYAASSSTYGDHPGLPKVEHRIGKPLSPYAVSKFANELYADVFSRTYGVSAVGLRYFNIFGKRQDPNGAYAAVIPRWIGSMSKGEHVFINGDGETSRDFCFVDNAVQMNILAALTGNDGEHEVYNVANNDRTTLNQLYTLIKERIMSRKPEIQFPEPLYRDFREGDVRHSQADISKAVSKLQYSPSHDVRTGLDQTVSWFLRGE